MQKKLNSKIITLSYWDESVRQMCLRGFKAQQGSLRGTLCPLRAPRRSSLCTGWPTSAWASAAHSYVMHNNTIFWFKLSDLFDKTIGQRRPKIKTQLRLILIPFITNYVKYFLIEILELCVDMIFIHISNYLSSCNICL